MYLTFKKNMDVDLTQFLVFGESQVDLQRSTCNEWSEAEETGISHLKLYVKEPNMAIFSSDMTKC